MGERLAAALRALQATYACIGDVRGRGLLAGIEFVRDRAGKAPVPAFGAAVSRRCFERGLNVNIVQLPGMGGVIRMAPPLTITPDEIDTGVAILGEAIADCLAAGLLDEA